MKELDFDELDKAVNSLMGGVAKKSTQPATKTKDGDTVLDISGIDPASSSSLFMDSMPDVATPAVKVDTATPAVKVDTATPAVKVDTATPATPVASPVATSVDDTTPDNTTSDDESDTVADEESVETTPEATATVVAEPGSLAARRSRAGRFMDVHHPSSDMKNPLNSPSSLPTRRGVTITAPARTTETTPVAPEAPVEAPTPVETVTPVEDEWPDPLAGFDPEPTTMSDEVKEEVSVEETTSTPSVDAPDESELSQMLDKEIEAIEDSSDDAKTDVDELDSLTTPFLVDAKVDKRPLGAPMTATPVVIPAPVPTPAEESKEEVIDSENDKPNRAPVFGALTDEATTGDPEDQLPPSAVDTHEHEPTLPEELQGDLMAIESGSAEVHELAATMTPEAETTSEEAKPVTMPVPSPSPMGEAKSTAPSPVGPSSIQPQYKEEASTGDQTNGSIYDTRGYHQPLEHPAKKKSGWLWIVWVVIILLVGAGSSAALYLLDII